MGGFFWWRKWATHGLKIYLPNLRDVFIYISLKMSKSAIVWKLWVICCIYLSEHIEMLRNKLLSSMMFYGSIDEQYQQLWFVSQTESPRILDETVNVGFVTQNHLKCRSVWDKVVTSTLNFTCLDQPGLTGSLRQLLVGIAHHVLVVGVRVLRQEPLDQILAVLLVEAEDHDETIQVAAVQPAGEGRRSTER